MRTLVQLRNLLKHQKKWRILESFDMLPDAQVLRTWRELLRIWSEQQQSEEFAVRARLRNWAVRALTVKHLACEQASLALISSV